MFINNWRSKLVGGAAAALIGVSMLPMASVNASASTSKASIKVMAEGFYSGAADPFSELPGSFQAAVKQINAAGGIHGHKIALTLCNDQDSPNVAQGCAIQAVSNHDVAVLTSEDLQSSAVLPTLESAGISYVGNLPQGSFDVTTPVAFPAGPGAYDSGPGVANTVVASGCKATAEIVLDAGAVTTTLENGFNKGLAAKGIPNVATIVAPIGTADYSSDVATAVAKGAQCIIGAVLPGDTVALMTAIQQAGNLTLISFGTSMPALSTLGSLGVGTYFEALSRIPTDQTPSVQAVDKAIKKWSPGTQLTTPGVNAFANVLLLKDALMKVTGNNFTSAIVRKALNGLKNASTDGVLHAYTAKASNASEPRQFNPYTLTYKITAPDTTKTIGTWTKLPGF
jgi:ABC-type branched-subunit amino acid transport system substrate-binding protein